MNDHSEYIRWGDHAGEGDAVTRTAESGDNTICLNWGNDLGASNTAANNSFRGTFGALTQANGIVTESFTGGNNGFNVSDADFIIGWKEFEDPNKVDVSFLLSGEASNTLATFLIQEIAESSPHVKSLDLWQSEMRKLEAKYSNAEKAVKDANLELEMQKEDVNRVAFHPHDRSCITTSGAALKQWTLNIQKRQIVPRDLKVEGSIHPKKRA